MSFAYHLMQTIRGATDRCYSWSMRGAFSRCGAGSRVGRNAKLVAPHLIEIGSDVVIGEYAWLNAKDDLGSRQATLFIGDGAYIGRFVQVNAWQRVTIGRQVLIGDRAFISDADHNFAALDVPIKLQGDRFVGAVTLMDGCWIGIGAAILPGVTIGRNAVVAANSVVTQSVPDCTVVGGVPARTIRVLEGV
jgi:acetyltransferase-like isoleucine patch superfamily enzyme